MSVEPSPPWLARLHRELGASEGLDVSRLELALREAGAATGWLDRAGFDDDHPYGRTIVHADDQLELMIAGWSRGRPCAPHDHGPGLGVVRVLQGRARHQGFVLRDGALVVELDERIVEGAFIACPRGRIHQMRDDGAELPLVTLHLYAGPTAPMVVYDLAERRTQWLRAGCGAWPRALGDAAVLRWADGFV